MGLNLKKCLTAFSATILGCATLLAANIRGTVTDGFLILSRHLLGKRFRKVGTGAPGGAPVLQ